MPPDDVRPVLLKSLRNFSIFPPYTIYGILGSAPFTKICHIRRLRSRWRSVVQSKELFVVGVHLLRHICAGLQNWTSYTNFMLVQRQMASWGRAKLSGEIMKDWGGCLMSGCSPSTSLRLSAWSLLLSVDNGCKLWIRYRGRHRK